MKIKNIMLSALFTLIGSCLSLDAHAIKAVFIDIEALFETSEWKASGYVGKLNGLSYITKIGHKPSQADLFKALKPISAQSKDIIYNQNLEMPLILSDWLLGNQPMSSLKTKIISFLNSSKTLKDIEKTVFSNVVNMMLTPSNLANTQKEISHTVKIIDQLKAQGLKVYLVGNCADMLAFKNEFSKVFAKLDGFFYSGQLHLLKPYQEFYTTVLHTTNIDANQSLWIETENTFIKNVQKFGYNVAIFNPNKPKNIDQELQKFGIKIK